MAIHIGKYIKQELKKQRMPVKVFAAKINRSRNVAYDIFERETVDTALLDDICRVLNCDFFSLFSSQKEYTQKHYKCLDVSDPEETYQRPTRESYDQLKQENRLLKNENDHLKKIIGLLESKKPGSKRGR